MTCFLKTCQTPGFLLILLFAQFAGQILHFAAISRASNYMPVFISPANFSKLFFFACLELLPETGKPKSQGTNISAALNSIPVFERSSTVRKIFGDTPIAFGLSGNVQ